LNNIPFCKFSNFVMSTISGFSGGFSAGGGWVDAASEGVAGAASAGVCDYGKK
jgi:hypothetical protein